MKGNMLIFAPLCLLLCWMLPVDSMTIRFNFTLRDANKDIPLSMVEDSVDDMYFGCNEAMMKKVKNKYFEKEKNVAPSIWKTCEKKLNQTDKTLTKYHRQAICAYTSYMGIYKKFNDAVRTEKSKYSTSFQFHSLHFLLTSAIQILNSKWYCHTTYRRTCVKFIGKVNQIIRFGSHTSSSYRTNLNIFGNKTCFKITTCTGAPLKKYSMHKEEEVLIPPYEMFNIIKIFNGRNKIEIQGLKDCEAVYVLESAGIKSNLNCKFV